MKTIYEALHFANRIDKKIYVDESKFLYYDKKVKKYLKESTCHKSFNIFTKAKKYLIKYNEKKIKEHEQEVVEYKKRLDAIILLTEDGL